MVNKKSSCTSFIWVLIIFITGTQILFISCRGGAPLVEKNIPVIEDGEGSIMKYPSPNTSTEMITGSGGYNYGNHMDDSIHTQFGVNCMNSCHMTSTMKWDEKNSALFKLTSPEGNENVDVCNKCHPPAVNMGLKTFNGTQFNRAPVKDFDGDGSVEGVQDEVQGLLDILLQAIQASGVIVPDQDPFWENVTTGAQKKAIYNWLFVRNDRSLGVHNTARSVQLLQFSYKDLTGREVPGAKPYSHVPIPVTKQSSIVIEPVMEMEGVTKDGKPIKASALPNVGTGSYVFLKGFCRTITSKNPAVSIKWSLVPPEGSKAVLKEIDPENVYFLADKMAWYEVKLIVTDSNGIVSEGTAQIHSAPYVGVGGIAGDTGIAPECASCHPGGSKIQGKTTHAKAFAYALDSSEGPGKSQFVKESLSLYTLGYNPDAANGGFDDVAVKAGWKLPEKYSPGNWAAMPLNLKQMASVQCESCHGPGGRWIAASISLSAQSCGSCHDSHIRNNKYGHWEQSEHAGAAALSYTVSLNKEESCLPCHSVESFIDATAGKKGSLRRFAAGRTGIQAVTCAVCHDPHEAAYKDQLRVYDNVTLPDGTAITNAGASAVCMTCHNGVVNTDEISESEPDFPHFSTAAEMITGTGGYDYGKPLDNSMHKQIGIACVDCHMARPSTGNTGMGSHTFRLVSETGAENLSACVNCHSGIPAFNRPAKGDYDGNGKVEGVREEVRGLLAILLAEIKESNVTYSDHEPFWENIKTQAQKASVYNWSFVSHDKSLGIHNAIRSIQLLQRSYRDLTGQEVPGADLL